MLHDGTNLRKVPYIIAMLRIVLAPFLFYIYLLEIYFIPTGIYIIATLSDIIDGYLARKFEVTSMSSLEAYIDASADFVFITVSFFAFVIKGIYPYWILIVLIGMFLFFILTSKSKRPVYDPIGKYYGSFLIATIGLTLIFPMLIIYSFVFLSFLVYTIILVVYRTYFLLKLRKNELILEEADNSFK